MNAAPSNELYFIINKFVENIAGLNQAMLQRTRLLKKHYDKDSNIITLDYQPAFNNNVEGWLLRTNKIEQGTKIINLYEYLREANYDSLEEKNHPVSEEGLNVSKRGNSYRFFDNGLYIKYKKYSDENKDKLEKIDYFNENRYCTRSDEFDHYGYLARTSYYNYFTREPNQELYYRTDGTCYLSKWYELRDGENKVIRMQMFDRAGEVTEVFHSEKDLKNYFLKNLFAPLDEQPIVVAEARSADKVIRKFNEVEIIKANIIHTNHLKEPYQFDSDINDGHTSIFDHWDKVNNLVVLTDAQKKDIEKRVNTAGKNITVIPHAIDREPVQDQEILRKKNNKKIVMIARLAYQKHVSEAVQAMNLVVKEHPDAILEIYGHGKHEESLQNLITKLDLNKHVTIKGYTKVAHEKFQEAGMSLLTSRYEGFGLVLLESLINYCPVVSYDIKYGPSDIIQDGYNGLLVKERKHEQLAKSIIHLMNNDDLLRNMQEHAVSQKSLGKFSTKTFADNWMTFFNEISGKQITEKKRGIMSFLSRN
ncbi:glycosyltransferase [Shouchella sp. JSM 1781072]|uniref:glycosyltransferase n=1 Tax=Bacillaceae TaxID=186817 RepID=UPI00159BB14B|nr:glycosyltransferase [Bacillus sp. Marseille-P3800]